MSIMDILTAPIIDASLVFNLVFGITVGCLWGHYDAIRGSERLAAVVWLGGGAVVYTVVSCIFFWT